MPETNLIEECIIFVTAHAHLLKRVEVEEYQFFWETLLDFNRKSNQRILNINKTLFELGHKLRETAAVNYGVRQFASPSQLFNIIGPIPVLYFIFRFLYLDLYELQN